MKLGQTYSEYLTRLNKLHNNVGTCIYGGCLKMQNYENAMNIMNERFGKDSLIAIATTDGERLFNRIVDA